MSCRLLSNATPFVSNYVSHEQELIVKGKKAAAQVESWKTSQGAETGPERLVSGNRKAELQKPLEDALRTEQDYR